MRLAYICADPGVPVFGLKGCSIHVQEMLRAFQAQGAQIGLFATRFDGVALPGITIHELPPAPKGDAALREKQCIAANDELPDCAGRQFPTRRPRRLVVGGQRGEFLRIHRLGGRTHHAQF